MSEGDHDLKTIVGSRTYMAPEVFDKEKGHGKPVDLYAVGIIMYILYENFILRILILS
jgi:calcium/calmodulin-dependent protein kinase I